MTHRPPSSLDIELIQKLAEAFDEYAKEMPLPHLLAAMHWFAAYTTAVVKEIEAKEKVYEREAAK